MPQIAKVANIAKELRVHFCNANPSSKGLREFIGKEYLNLKKSYPDLPILIREARGIETRIFGRYEKGVEKKVILDDLSYSQVEKKFKELIQG